MASAHSVRFNSTKSPGGHDGDKKIETVLKEASVDIAVDPTTLATFFESEFFTKIQETPAAIAKIQSLVEYGVAQGYVDPAGKSLGLFKLFKLVSDKEFKKQVGELRDIMEKNGISLTPEDTTTLLTLFGKK